MKKTVGIKADAFEMITLIRELILFIASPKA